jgi:transcriptional regulator with XRE-family HTH domain
MLWQSIGLASLASIRAGYRLVRGSHRHANVGYDETGMTHIHAAYISHDAPLRIRLKLPTRSYIPFRNQAEKDQMSTNTPKYCRCGNRLAWNHAGALCGSCERQTADYRAEAPAVTPAFWNTPALRDALAAQHIGRVARAYRRHSEFTARYGRDGVSQELLGSWLGLTQAQVSRIENGPPVRNLDTLAHWARVLQIPPRLLWFKLPPGRTVNEPGKKPQLASAISPPAETSQLLPAADGLAHDPDAVAMRAFRTADLQAGGGHLYASVVRYLQADMAPRLFGTDAGASNPALFTAAAGLTEMAGWMAHDAGRDASAKRHFGRALALVQVGGDHQLTAHILGSMSHLASYLGAPDEADDLARQGRAALQAGPANPALEARMLALEARGVAGKEPADPAECARLLLRAERALEDTPASPVSTWVSHFDQGSLASETTRSLRQHGDLEQARQQAERIISLRPSHRTRSRAFGQLALASVLIAQREPNQAVGIASDVLDATQSLGSYLVISQLIQLQRQLEPYSGNAVVAEFLDCLQDALPDRLVFYQLTAEGLHLHEAKEGL